MAQQDRTGIGEGIRTGIGVLTAFKEAIEETLEETIARGDLSPDRAKEVMKDAADRIQLSLEDARERLDFVPRKEFEALRREMEQLTTRIAALEGGASGDSQESGGSAAGSIPVD